VPQSFNLGYAMDHIPSAEVLISSLSKDVEAVTRTLHDTIILFRENQAMLNRVLADMQEHKALDQRIHTDFLTMQEHIYGKPNEPGLVTKVHELNGKVGNLWKLFWAIVTAAATAGGGAALTFLNMK